MILPQQRLAAGAADILGRPLEPGELDGLTKYAELLIKWQKSQRLVGSTDPTWIVDHVLLDSVLFVRLLSDDVRDVVDVGSGAGLPGLPLKIVRNELAITLVESRQKRASFLSAAVRELQLTGCLVVNARLEAVTKDFPGRFDVAVARCAGDPQRLLGAVEEVLRPTGIVIASGPPQRRPIQRGDWREVEWAGGRRLFWVYRKS